MLSIVRRVFLTLITVVGLSASFLASGSAPLLSPRACDYREVAGGDPDWANATIRACVEDSKATVRRGTFVLLLTVAAFGACLLILKDEPRREDKE